MWGNNTFCVYFSVPSLRYLILSAQSAQILPKLEKSKILSTSDPENFRQMILRVCALGHAWLTLWLAFSVRSRSREWGPKSPGCGKETCNKDGGDVVTLCSFTAQPGFMAKFTVGFMARFMAVALKLLPSAPILCF